MLLVAVLQSTVPRQPSEPVRSGRGAREQVRPGTHCATGSGVREGAEGRCV